jgi:hypothetical protein
MRLDYLLHSFLLGFSFLFYIFHGVRSGGVFRFKMDFSYGGIR